jgi:hypothetical protein
MHSVEPLTQARIRPTTEVLLQNVLSPKVNPPYRFADSPRLAIAVLSFSSSVDTRKCEIASPGRIRPVRYDRLSHPPMLKLELA